MNDAGTLFERCRWPDLAPPYAEALRQAVGFILARFADTTGIVVSGTILRGNPAPTSDLDIYVIRQKPQRQRLQQFFNGVPAEIFVNPAAMVLRYFDEERKEGRPIAAHMLATGFTVLELDPAVADLRRQAQHSLTLRPDPAPQRLTAARYMAATRYEDATDIVVDRPEAANMILGLAVYDMLHYYFLRANRYLPRDKDLLDALGRLDAGLAELARDFYGAGSLERRLAIAEQIADCTIETRGFFAWESNPEDVR